MHAIEQVNVDLSGAIMRMKNTKNQLDRASIETNDYSWASNALDAVMQVLKHLAGENPQPGRDKITYTNVIGDLRIGEKMWSIGHAEAPDVGEFQFYVSAEGYIVYWFIDSSTPINIVSQLDFALATLNQCDDESLRRLRTVAGHLVCAVS